MPFESRDYDWVNVAKRTGFTPSVINLLGGSPWIDSYTPASQARFTMESYTSYLTRAVNYSPGELIDYLYQVADTYGIPRGLAYRQIARESNFNPDAKGSSGEIGIAQFLPSTASAYGLTSEDLKDPFKSLDAYGRHMRDLLNMFGGDERMAVAAYNAGAGRVTNALKGGARWLLRLPQITQEYVNAIAGEGANTFDELLPGFRWENICSDQEGNIVDCSTPGAIRERVQVRDAGIGAATQNLLGIDLGDAGKRIGLVILAIVLIAVAVVSFR